MNFFAEIICALRLYIATVNNDALIAIKTIRAKKRSLLPGCTKKAPNNVVIKGSRKLLQNLALPFQSQSIASFALSYP
jgi:hypothetical protein